MTTLVKTQLKPALKWAGGKTRLAPHLQELWHPHRHRRLVEPFCGALGATFALMPDNALLNDVNPHLINFHRWVKSGLEVTLDMLNNREHYDCKRKLFNQFARDEEWYTSHKSAELFYYLNRTCFNGLCRFNKKGEFNVPFGKYKTINYRQDFYEYIEPLKHWQFTCGDFEELQVTPNSLIYVDPPYDTEFTTYSAGGFNWADQVRLVNWLLRFDIPIIASNQATPRILELYDSAGFNVRVIDAPRSVSCTGDRTPAKEMLAVRNFEV